MMFECGDPAPVAEQIADLSVRSSKPRTHPTDPTPSVEFL